MIEKNGKVKYFVYGEDGEELDRKICDMKGNVTFIAENSKL